VGTLGEWPPLESGDSPHIIEYIHFMNRPFSPPTSIIAIALLIAIFSSACRISIHGGRKVKKPVIYLYPTLKSDVEVKLETEMDLTLTEPVYANGWKVTASPDGKLVNAADGRIYTYLFWEATDRYEYNFDQGFCIAGEEVEAFLDSQLVVMGSNETEKKDFIAYWLPDLRKNKFNLITFPGAEYTSRAELHITPEPNSILRVFMVFKACNEPVKIPAQHFPSFHRNGFTVVEWGGTDVSIPLDELN